MRGLIKFIAALIVLAIIIVLALVIFDMTAYARDPAHTTASAVLTGVRNLFPANWVERYELWRVQFLLWFDRVFGTAESAA